MKLRSAAARRWNMATKSKQETRDPKERASHFIAMVIVLALFLACGLGCSSSAKEGKSKSNSPETSFKTADASKAEPKSGESKAVDPAVQSELEKMEAEKRAILLKDAQSALEDTRNALAALDNGDKAGALAALERVTGKLGMVIARDPKMAFAPVSVTTTVVDLYATPDTVKTVVKQAKENLSNDRVQQARLLITDLASEADIHVTEIPLATYPGAISAVAPLVDAGRTDEAKAALYAVLNTLVIETFVVPLPKIRAEAILAVADALASKSDRKEEDKTKVRSLIDATRREIQLAEALGYGTRDSYKPLYAQLDEVQQKTDGGQLGKGLVAKLRHSLKSFKFSSSS
jgi:hypothetical protein